MEIINSSAALQIITLSLRRAIHVDFGEEEDNLTIKLEPPTNHQYGDYSTNVAWQLATATLKPMTIAAQLVERLNQDQTLMAICDKIVVAGGGFINFYLSLPTKIAIFNHLTSPQLTYLNLDITRPVTIVEFSSPNIAKPFTIGHLRSTIIGAAIANLLEAVGQPVVRDNHLGDWGTQFGKQIVALQKWGNWDEICHSESPIKELVTLYVKFHQEAAQDPTLEDEARLAFKQLDDGDPHYLELWQQIINLSLQEFGRLYDQLGIKFDENQGKGYGESAARALTAAVVTELKTKELLTESQEAQIVEFPAEDKLPPLMIIKKDGSTLYATRDLATDLRRRQQYGPRVTIINEVGAEQQVYFRQLYRLEQLLGWFEPAQRVHIAHGLYRFADRKMSTRTGDVIWLDDVLREAINKVASSTIKQLLTSDIEKIAIGAIKWNDLVREPKHNIDFNLQAMLSLKGNSGPYLQYTVVRVRSILKKSENEALRGFEKNSLIDTSKIETEALTTAEIELLTKIINYEDNLSLAAHNLAPHLLAAYLFDLATTFNNFYEHNPILNNPVRECLAAKTALVLTGGLAILGIQIPTKM